MTTLFVNNVRQGTATVKNVSSLIVYNMIKNTGVEIPNPSVSCSLAAAEVYPGSDITVNSALLKSYDLHNAVGLNYDASVREASLITHSDVLCFTGHVKVVGNNKPQYSNELSSCSLHTVVPPSYTGEVTVHRSKLAVISTASATTQVVPDSITTERCVLIAHAVYDGNTYRCSENRITVRSIEKTQLELIKPADQNAIEVNAGEAPALTTVNLDLAVSFDTYFDFNMRSISGIRSVLNEDDVQVAVRDDTYRLEDLIPGKNARRTIVTNNDFKLVLNIKPTIVKNSVL